MMEEVFLSTLRENPSDDVTRRVFSDWLEEQDDPVCRLKAEYIRTDLELATLPRKPKRKGHRKRLVDRRREIADRLDLHWMAVVTLAKIECCTFSFKCPLKWESLAKVEGETNVRHCSACNENVYFCGSLRDARRHTLAGHCVAIDPRVIRVADSLSAPEEIARGMMIRDDLSDDTADD